MTDPNTKLLDQRITAAMDRQRVAGGGEGGHIHPMEGRVSRVEAIQESLLRDTAEIKASLNVLVERLSRMPTVAGLWGMVATVVAVSVAVIALFVGVLTYLQAFPPA